MRAKYFDPEKQTITYGPGGPACSEEAVIANGGALAFDGYSYALHPILACWRVTGLPIIIGDSAFSVMQGFERFNFNIRALGTSPPVPTVTDLNGLVV